MDMGACDTYIYTPGSLLLPLFGGEQDKNSGYYIICMTRSRVMLGRIRKRELSCRLTIRYA